MTIAIVALVLSATLLAAAVTVLVLLRRGDGPTYSASRAYDANRREAIRLLTGTEVEAAPRDQWFVRPEPPEEEGLARAHADAVLQALAAVVPADRGLAALGGRARLPGAEILPAVTTDALRASGALESWEGPTLLVAIVLANPEPPGGDAARVTLPVQTLFPALERAGRRDLIDRFAALRDRAASLPHDEIVEVP